MTSALQDEIAAWKALADKLIAYGLGESCHARKTLVEWRESLDRETVGLSRFVFASIAIRSIASREVRRLFDIDGLSLSVTFSVFKENGSSDCQLSSSRAV